MSKSSAYFLLKVVSMDDVVLSGIQLFLMLVFWLVLDFVYVLFKSKAHRRDNLAASLRSLCNELKAKEPQSERKRKKVSTKKDDKASSSNAPVRTTDL